VDQDEIGATDEVGRLVERQLRHVNELLINMTHDLFMQVYGNKKYHSHAPTRMQWLNVGAALTEAGVKLPDDWATVIGGPAL
jgi:hypothetical protein